MQYEMMKKPWKNTYKMHDACSLKSKLSCNHSCFILFLSAEIRPKHGNKNTTIHLSTRILGFKSKRWSLGFLRIVQPKIQKSIFSNRIFGPESKDSVWKRWIFGFLGSRLDHDIKNPKKLMSSALGHKMHFCLEYIAEIFAHSGFANNYF